MVKINGPVGSSLPVVLGPKVGPVVIGPITAGAGPVVNSPRFFLPVLDLCQTVGLILIMMFNVRTLL
jgi:hypothetical protein